MEKYYLGIDYGDNKIGLALADSETKMAFGYLTIANNLNLIENLGKIFKEYEIEAIVIGIPDFETNENEKKIKDFSEKIDQAFGIKIQKQNEIFTTKMAQSRLKEAGKKNLGKLDDMEAAKIILQDWIDKN